MHHSRWPAILAVGLLVITVFVGLWSGTIDTAAAQAQATCRWKNLGQSTLARYFEGGAFDTDSNQMYYYGGLDGSRVTQDDVGMLDLSDPDLDSARHRTIPVNAKKRYGSAGAYRSAGDDSALFFFGGAASVANGRGTGDVQSLTAKDLNWSEPQITGTLETRLFAAAAYDPDHDLIVITGGIRECAEDDLPCDATQFVTRYLRFDGAGGMTFEDGPAGGPTTVFGHSMVYDSLAKRMVVYGGARRSDRPENKVYTLDLSGPDPAAAAWSESTPTGGPSGLALHGGAFDAKRNWLVVYGGATSDLFVEGDESANTKAYALDLGSAAPVWTDLSATFGERVGSVMGFDPLHEVAVSHAGRRRVTSSDSSDAFRDSHALVCEDQTPGTPGTATTPPPATTEVPTVAPTTPAPTEPATPTETATTPPPTTEVPTETATMPPPATTEVPTETAATPPPGTTEVPTETAVTPPPATTEVPTNTPTTPADGDNAAASDVDARCGPGLRVHPRPGTGAGHQLRRHEPGHGAGLEPAV
jgi:hypothetical protein